MNKLVMDEIKKIDGKDPAMMQWLSAAVSAVAGEVVGFNNWLGAAIDILATKFNELAENPEKVLIAVYPGLIGHVSLVIDNEEINYGRYVDSSSSGSLQSPIGEAGIIIYKDFENKKGDNPGTEVLVLDLTPEEAKQVVQVFKNIINKDAYFWQEKVDENKSALDAAYRFNEDISYKDYVLWKRNCTTFTMDILKSALGEDDPRIKTIKNDWISGLVGADLAYMNKNK